MKGKTFAWIFILTACMLALAGIFSNVKAQTVIALSKENDSLKHALLIQTFEIRREIGYLNIVINNPKQIVFLKGWSIRDGIMNEPVYQRSLHAKKRKLPPKKATLKR